MWLPLRYLATGMLAWLLAAAGVPLLAAHLVASFDDPKIFALTHLVVLGWVTMTIMGALYQLFPVALQASLAAPAVGRWNFILYAAGVAGFVPSFYFDWTPGVAIFGSLAVVGIVIFAITLLLSYPSVRARHPMGLFVLCGLGWLVVVIGFGLTWALDWQFRWFNISPNLLAAHVHAGLVGWLGCTLMGVSYKLMELFALAHRRTWRSAYLILAVWNVALVALILSLLLWPGGWEVTGAAIALGATMLWFAFDLARMWTHRRRRRISVEQGHIAMSLLSLLLACGIGITLTVERGFPRTGSWPTATQRSWAGSGSRSLAATRRSSPSSAGCTGIRDSPVRHPLLCSRTWSMSGWDGPAWPCWRLATPRSWWAFWRPPW